MKDMARAIYNMHYWNLTVHIRLDKQPTESQLDRYLKNIALQKLCNAVYGFAWFHKEAWKITLLIQKEEQYMPLKALKMIFKVSNERIRSNTVLDHSKVVEGLKRLLSHPKTFHNYYNIK
jgi:hypothetical protein